ncbi:uncharacterized protein LOC143142424 [Alosa pseudoharengus]|uniref:uncharacterized protein LOC143142424 n=1 Tax=Alosa pseudoharengus TaxID=34774 RepID=UPI003F8BB9D8
MGQCTYFRKFIKDQQKINKVINVRNCTMHSPDFTISQQDFQQYLEKIKDFAHHLDQHVHDLKMLPKEIEKIIDTVDNGLGPGLQGHGTEGKQKSHSDALQQKCMEMEQKALKEKIEFLTQRYEENQDGVKEEIEGIKTFLQKNEDLKEKLAPQLEQLQRRVDEHEKQINMLNERVDQLEVKVTQGPKTDPLFSMNPLKYKNYVFELARKYGWPEPVFTESLEGDGYRGHVEVNGLTFSGEQACLNKKLAHQEVAKKALDHLQTLAPSAEVHTGEEQQTKHPVEPSESSTSEGCMSGQDPAKTASQYYYGSVIVVLDTEVASEEGCGQEKEAIEAAYGKLAHLFGLDEAKAGSSKQGLVQEHFQERGFPPPAEISSKCPDETFHCKLKLCGAFTFHDQEGSTKKKQAEHQAAKTALQQLSRVLDWTASGENYKGDLKERLEAQSLGQPSYDVTKKESLPGGERGRSVALAGCEPAGSSSMNLPPGGTSAPNSKDQPSAAELKPQPTKPDPAVIAPMIPTTGLEVIVNEPSVINMEVCSTETDRQLEDMDMSLSRVSGNGTQPAPVKEESTSTSVEGTRFYGSVTVVLDTELQDQDGQLQEGDTIESAYRKLAESFGLDKAKPGSSRAVVHMYFERSGYPLPVENVQKCIDDKIRCRLKLCGSFTFVDREGSIKRKQAEQQAAKTALQQLSRVLDWTASGENYKGDLKERLEAQGLGQPSYDVTKKESLPGGERGRSVALAGCEPAGSSSMHLPPGGTSAPNSKDQPSAAELKPQPTKPDPAVVAPMIPTTGLEVIVNEPSVINMEVCSTETDRQLEDMDMSPSRVLGNGTQPLPVKEESTSTSVEGTRFYGSVTVVLDTELQDQDGQLQEGDAIESAYRKLAESFGLDKAKPGSSRAVVHMYFERSGYPLPVENVQKCIDDKIKCSLKLCGSFTFVDREGSIKRKQAEQQAAKTALQQLSRVLDWTASGENYKGDLKERLEAQGLGQPSYDVTKKESLPGGERGRSVALAGSELAGSSNMSLPPGGTSAPNSIGQPSAAELKPQPTKPDPAVVAPMIPTTGCSPPPVHRKQAKLQFQGEKVERLLVLLGLLPPVVTCEKYSMEQRFTCSVIVQLDQYTFRSPDCSKSKKEASRKAFHSFGLATGICRPGADETCSTQEVKQYFAKRSLPCPIEEFGGQEKAFSCSLTNVSCKLVYEGQGSTEGDARQAAFQDAFTKLGRLFGLSGIPGARDKADKQLTALLKMADQGEPACSLKAQQHKASIQLKFTDYKLEHKSSTNKKQARNYLSERILKMLGVDTDASTSRSLRNSLDEWCKQKKLPEPKFEEMKELLGVRVTFSAPFSCSSRDWEDSWQQAEQSLLQELTARLSWNKEDGTSSSGSSSL